MSKQTINVEKIKKDFPIFNRCVNGKNLVYLDSAATSQKPNQVIEAVVDYYKNHNANVHRGAHFLGDEATDIYEETRKKVAKFIGAPSEQEVIFTKNTTESINLVAYSWGKENITAEDTILLSNSEHNSNLLPWIQLAKEKNATVAYLEINDEGKIEPQQLEKIKPGVKLIALSHASNVLGTIFDIKKICRKAKDVGATTVIDGSQAIPHLKVNVQSLGCDFYAFSGHKMLGPMGIGVLWGKKFLLEKMSPFLYGGGMIRDLSIDNETQEINTNWMEIPYKFEAGTPNVAGAAGLSAAIDYIENIGLDAITEHEKNLNEYAIEKLGQIEGLQILGPLNPGERTGLTSFTVTGSHPHDVASILNSLGIAVRSGTHCAMKLHKDLEINSSIRASYYIYNSQKDIDKLIEGLKKAKEILK